MPKICTVDNNNTFSTIKAPLYNPIQLTFQNLNGISNVTNNESRQNNLGNTVINLDITVTSFLSTISFDIVFPNNLLNPFFNTTGHTDTSKLIVNDLVVYKVSDKVITVKMTSRASSYTLYKISLQN